MDLVLNFESRAAHEVVIITPQQNWLKERRLADRHSIESAVFRRLFQVCKGRKVIVDDWWYWVTLV